MSSLTNPSISTSGAILDPEIIASHRTSNAGYVGAFIPLIVVLFIVGALWDRLGLREQVADWLNQKFGKRLQEKARTREDIIERKEREQKRLDDLFRISSAPRSRGDMMV